jgi:hypothetical protein
MPFHRQYVQSRDRCLIPSERGTEEVRIHCPKGRHSSLKIWKLFFFLNKTIPSVNVQSATMSRLHTFGNFSNILKLSLNIFCLLLRCSKNSREKPKLQQRTDKYKYL